MKYYKINNSFVKNSIPAVYFALLLIFSVYNATSQNVPPVPNPPKLVNDFAGIMTPDQINQLEHRLVSFNDTTSTQISVVTVKNLDGYEIEEYAHKLAETWGIGQKGKDNGILVLVKPKISDEKGQVRIEVGYGLEGAVPDAISNRIISHDLIPHFKTDDYYGGINAAVTSLMQATKGEYKTEVKDDSWIAPLIGTIAIIVAIMILIGVIITNKSKKAETITNGKNNDGKDKDGCLNALLVAGLLSNTGSRGGGHSGFGGGFGGGGFGGFGGGGFGGGGASGSW